LAQHANRTGEIDEDCNAENEGPLHRFNIAYPAGAVEALVGAFRRGRAGGRGGASAGGENA
jgi:hypothetical protein